MKDRYFVYILSSAPYGTLYTGLTSDLIGRVYQHKMDMVEGFTNKYGCHTLVYYETTGDVNSALTREKQIKSWHRVWKIRLIEKDNPQWRDLYDDLL